MIATALSALVSASLLALALGTVVSPRPLAENYGLPVDEATGIAYVRALGARDGVLGLLVAWFLIRRSRGALTATIGTATLIGLADFSLVRAVRPEARKSLSIHGSGVVGLTLLWLLLLRKP